MIYLSYDFLSLLASNSTTATTLAASTVTPAKSTQPSGTNTKKKPGNYFVIIE